MNRAAALSAFPKPTMMLQIQNATLLLLWFAQMPSKTARSLVVLLLEYRFPIPTQKKQTTRLKSKKPMTIG